MPSSEWREATITTIYQRVGQGKDQREASKFLRELRWIAKREGVTDLSVLPTLEEIRGFYRVILAERAVRTSLSGLHRSWLANFQGATNPSRSNRLRHKP